MVISFVLKQLLVLTALETSFHLRIILHSSTKKENFSILDRNGNACDFVIVCLMTLLTAYLLIIYDPFVSGVLAFKHHVTKQFFGCCFGGKGSGYLVLMYDLL